MKRLDLDESLIGELYKNGESMTRIAEKLNTSKVNIRNRVISMGIHEKRDRSYYNIPDIERKNEHIKKTLNNGKRVWEHRWIMEQHLGRKLKKNEVVHHINEIRYDNRIENLKLMTDKEHKALHVIKRDSYNLPKKELEELYIKQDMTMLEVGNKLNCSMATVSRYLKKHGIVKLNSNRRGFNGKYNAKHNR